MTEPESIAEIKYQCRENGDCQEWEAYVQHQLKSYDARTTQQIAATMTGSIFLAFAASLLILASNSLAVRKLSGKILIVASIVSPIVLLGALAAFIGIVVSFGACFKQACSGSASWAPMLFFLGSLFISIPLGLLFYKRRNGLMGKMMGMSNNKLRLWGIVLLLTVTTGTFVLINSARDYNAVDKRNFLELNTIE